MYSIWVAILLALRSAVFVISQSSVAVCSDPSGYVTVKITTPAPSWPMICGPGKSQIDNGSLRGCASGHVDSQKTRDLPVVKAQDS